MKLELQRGHFYGRVSRSREVAAVTLAETRYPSGSKLPRHSHERAYFCFVLQGSFVEGYGNKSRACQPATLIFHPSGETHWDHFQTEVHCLNVQPDSNLNYQALQLTQPADFHGGALAHLAKKLYREFREMDEVSALAIEGLTLEMIAEATRSFKRKADTIPTWLKRAQELLHAHFAERLTLSYVAASVGVHPTHLAREFHKHHNLTIGEYVRQLRIEFACRQLSASDIPISEIAMAAGFFDQSHFSRTVKTLTGLSPAAYRKMFKAR
jgi:AraC family transcriptional regulator